MIRSTTARALALTFLGLPATIAAGGTTPVNVVTPSDNVSVIDILNNTYGGSFAGSVGGVLSNGTVTAARFNDFMAGPLDSGTTSLQLGSGVGDTDQVWRDGTVAFSARAVFAGYDQYFGYRLGTAPGSGATAGMKVNGFGFAVTGAGNWFVGPGDFQWLRAGVNNFQNTSNQGLVYSSIAANNLDSVDHMVTYAISGPGLGTRYMLFWEDLPALRGTLPGDYDYNDLAIELVVAIPLPTGAALSGAALLALAARRRR